MQKTPPNNWQTTKPVMSNHTGSRSDAVKHLLCPLLYPPAVWITVVPAAAGIG